MVTISLCKLSLSSSSLLLRSLSFLIASVSSLCVVDCFPSFSLVHILEFCPILSFGHVSLPTHLGCLSMFVSIFYIDLSYLTVLAEWTYIVSVLWDTVA